MSLADDLSKPAGAEDFSRESQRKIIQTLRADNRRLQQMLGDWESLADRFSAEAKILPKPKPSTIKWKPSKEHRELVAILSDAHATEAWTLAQTDGQTFYDFETFCQMLWYYGKEIVRIANECRGRHGLNILHLDVLGDIFHGTLRLEDEVTNDFPSAPGIANTASVLYQWISSISQHFEQVFITCVAGNHGRNHVKPQSKRYVAENKDTLIYLFVKSMISATNLREKIAVIIPNSRVHTFRRMGHQIKIAHGDHIKGGNSIAGLPIYGLSRDMLRQFRKELKSDKVKKGIDLFEIGHFHSHSVLENMLIVNGALCPTAPWAFDELGMLSDPEQVVYQTSERFTHAGMLPLSLKHGIGQKHELVYDVSLR